MLGGGKGGDREHVQAQAAGDSAGAAPAGRDVDDDIPF
jgi:hypothetical protein